MSTMTQDRDRVDCANLTTDVVPAAELSSLNGKLRQFEMIGFPKLEDKERLANLHPACDHLIRKSASRLKPDESAIKEAREPRAEIKSPLRSCKMARASSLAGLVLLTLVVVSFFIFGENHAANHYRLETVGFAGGLLITLAVVYFNRVAKTRQTQG